jgi:hypothetical protein
MGNRREKRKNKAAELHEEERRSKRCGRKNGGLREGQPAE